MNRCSGSPGCGPPRPRPTRATCSGRARPPRRRWRSPGASTAWPRASASARSPRWSFCGGAQDKALQHLSRASPVFDEVGDARGKATGSLTRARMLGRLSRDDEAVAGRPAGPGRRPGLGGSGRLPLGVAARPRAVGGGEGCHRALCRGRPGCAAGPATAAAHRAVPPAQGAGPVMRSYLEYKDRVPAEA